MGIPQLVRTTTNLPFRHPAGSLLSTTNRCSWLRGPFRCRSEDTWWSSNVYQPHFPFFIGTRLYVRYGYPFGARADVQGYAIVAELPSARLRSRSIVLGRFTYVCSAIAAQQLNVRMVASDAFNWRAKSGLFWLGCNVICFTWAFFRLPETGGFSFAELDILFANRVPARKFKKAAVKGGLAPFLLWTETLTV